ncbi:MAG: exopolysaccharide biosynthesis protein [Microbacterium sp. SCN 70-200]|uniref:phosphodiester glycosidase family protein n=1 Tax=unclassified Microbacterium TaxID=2609290 RepID=UPI00086A9AF2|nr:MULTISPECIES: phosphodiester glycosidase family protein [unclassified Microbacterium]MBN9215071.1 phosphodiester glycosidase family protein [Microbacterium sp.]ODT42848.1 MAG: exopolysaccharide biosynthesis protein [Microbacterium sp. SCN 70-200]OJV84845.1 MAG: exopolysaccharide biosynthesis protein [Microbacterium sp. 70-16]
MKRRLKHSLIAGGIVVALTATGGTAWALDRFVIPHVVVDDVAAYEAEQSASATPAATDDTADAEASTPVITDTTYTSDAASITVTQYTQGSGDDTVTYYVADLDLSDPTVLRSAFANNQFGENITALVSETAEANGAVLAVNGDYYGFRDSGIVIRNGVVYRDDGAREGLVFYKDGTVAIYDETQTTAAELVADGAWNTLSFGPAIVDDGAVIDGIDDVEIDTNIGNHSIQGEQPRTAIGVTADGHILIVVVDGRDPGYSRGVTLTELADIMISLGATTAYNLDGGGSSELWFNGEVVNQPSNGGERATSDILYVAG